MKAERLRLLVVLFLCIGMTVLQAQGNHETITSVGGSAFGVGGSVSYSVGQVICKTYSGNSGSVAHGVQQAYGYSVIEGIGEENELNQGLLAYPNPTTHNLTLQMECELPGQYIALLYDINGKLLSQKSILGNLTSIHMSHLVPSSYFIVISQPALDSGIQKVLKSFKIIKN